MNLIVFHIASGHSFFTGMLLVLTAVLMSSFSHPIARRVTGLSFAIGVIAIVVSSAAIPYWCYGLCIAASIGWVASAFFKSWRVWTRIGLSAACLIATGFELPYHVTRDLRPTEERTITVIGDSITAGMGASDASDRWPAILAVRHDLEVQDISYPGETTFSALERAQLY